MMFREYKPWKNTEKNNQTKDSLAFFFCFFFNYYFPFQKEHVNQ